MKRYTKTGEWIEIEGDVGRIGVVSQVAKAIGEVIYVMLPGVNHRISKGQLAASLECTDRVWSVHAPASGRVLAVNECLREMPSIVNSSLDCRAWLFEIHLSKPAQVEKLLNYDELLALIGSSQERSEPR